MVALIIAAGAVALLAFFANIIARSTIWQPSILYDLLSLIKRNAVALLIGLYVFIAFFILYHYWGVTAGYMEEIAEASKALVSQDEQPIHLSPLLRQVEDRMNQIKQTALRNERAAREEAQRKNDLIVYLAHDIKTPLTSVIGYLSMLDEADDIQPQQRAKYIGLTLEKAYRLDQLVDEFFEITRFNLAHISVNKTRINLTMMLHQMADEFYPMLAPQYKTAVVQAPEELMLWGDADKLSRVFNNILKNAIAYSYHNCEIEIGAVQQGDHAVVTFANQGDPIPKEKLDMIFEKFFRLDAARSTNTGGAGLGLAIAKEIVTAHGGTITVTSDAQRTVFTVVLPIASP